MRKGMKSDCSDDIATVMKEITMNTNIKSIAIAVAIAGLLAAQPAAADTLIYGGVFPNGYVLVNINSVTPALTVNNARAGQFLMTDVTTSNTFNAWCVDIFHDLALSQSYNLQSASAFYTNLGDAGKAT